MKYKYRFSIFTATYNRGNLLNNLYSDLLKQTYKGAFEWIIIDDGSTDDTEEIVKKIINENEIDIKYRKNKNGGKHTAWRTANPLFEGQYVITCDDDDPITSDMLDVFDRTWKDLETSANYNEFWEVRSRVQYEDGTLIGKPIPGSFLDSDYNEISFKMNNKAEMVGCRKVEILRTLGAVPDNFIFEKNCSNFPEFIRWSRVARKYKTRFIPNITRTLVQGHDSLTSKGDSNIKKTYNALITNIYRINEQYDLYIKYNKYKYFRAIYSLVVVSKKVNKDVSAYITHGLSKYLYKILFKTI